MAKFKNDIFINPQVYNVQYKYTLDDLENDEQFQEVSQRFLTSIGEKSDDIFEYLRDSDFNLLSGMQLAMDSGKFSEQQQQDYAYLRNKFQGADVGSFKQYLKLAKDGLVDIATDPTAIAAALAIPFTGGSSAAARQALALGVKKGIQGVTAENIKLAGRQQIGKAAAANAAIGGVYTTADNHFRQTAQLNTGLREAYSGKELAAMGLVGSAAGGLLGAGAKALQVKNSTAASRFTNDSYRDSAMSDGMFSFRKGLDTALSKVGGSAVSILNTMSTKSNTARLLGQITDDSFDSKILAGRLKAPSEYSFAENLDFLRSTYINLFDAAMKPIRKTGFIDAQTERNVIRIIRGDKGRFSAVEQRAAKKVKELFNKVAKDAKDANLSLNEVLDYFPRSWNRKAIVDNTPEFINKLFKDKALKNPNTNKPLTKKEVGEVVENMLNKNNELYESHSNLIGQARVFDINDLDYEKFLTNDLVEVTQNYLLNAARVIQHKKSYLLPGKGVKARYTQIIGDEKKALSLYRLSNEEQFIQRWLDPIEKELKEKNLTLTKRDKEKILDLYKSVTGQVEFFDSPTWQGLYDATKLANSMAYLPLATLSSATELLIPLLKTSPDKSAKALLRSLTKGSKILREETIGRIGKKYPELSDDKLLNEMRSVWIAMDESVGDVTNRLAGEGLQNEFARKGARAFFRFNLLIPWTKTVQAASFSVGKDIIRGNLKKLKYLQDKGVDVFASPSKYVKNINKNKTNFLKEFKDDLTQGRIENLKSELYGLNIDPRKGLKWLDDGAKETSTFYSNDLLRGAARFTNSVILQTGRERAKVPTYMTNPKWDILTQFLRYPYVFSNTVLKNFLKESIDKPGVGTSKLLTFNVLATNIALETNYWRTSDEIRKRRDVEGVNREDILRAFQRTGMLGPMDVALRWRDGLRYGQSPTLAASNLGGPIINDVLGVAYYQRYAEQLARKTPGYGSKELLKRITIPGTEIKPFKPVGEAYDDWVAYNKEFDRRFIKEPLKSLQEPRPKKRFYKGGEVSKDVEFVKDEAENRIDPLTGLPYAMQSDILIDSILREERKERLGFVLGGIVSKKIASKVGRNLVKKLIPDKRPSAYHGSPAKFDEFANLKKGGAMEEGVGYYFTDVEDYAKTFAGDKPGLKNVYKTKLNVLDEELINPHKGLKVKAMLDRGYGPDNLMSKKETDKIIKAVKNVQKDLREKGFDDEANKLQEYLDSGNLYEVIQGYERLFTRDDFYNPISYIEKTPINLKYPLIQDALKEQGFKGLKIKQNYRVNPLSEEGIFKPQTTYVLFDKKDIQDLNRKEFGKIGSRASSDRDPAYMGLTEDDIIEETSFDEYYNNLGEQIPNAFVMRMSTKNYLKLTTGNKKDIDRIKKEVVKGYESGRKFGKFNPDKVDDRSQPIYLYINKYGKITKHEGRHRAALIEAEGGNTVPVVIHLKEEPKAGVLNTPMSKIKKPKDLGIPSLKNQYNNGFDVSLSNEDVALVRRLYFNEDIDNAVSVANQTDRLKFAKGGMPITLYYIGEPSNELDFSEGETPENKLKGSFKNDLFVKEGTKVDEFEQLQKGFRNKLINQTFTEEEEDLAYKKLLNM